MAETNGQYGLFIDYKYCCGCNACVTACKMEHGMPESDFGIVVLQDGPRESSDEVWEYNYLPMPTHLCDLCAERTAEGKLPSCVHHCQTAVMVYGTVEELARKASATGRGDIAIFVR